MLYYNFANNRMVSKYFLPVLVVLVFVTQSLYPLAAQAASVPSNKVSAQNFGFILNSPYSVVAGQPTAAGEFKNGNISQANKYPEGACVPVVVEVDHNDTVAGDVSLTLVYDYSQGAGVIGYRDLEVLTVTGGTDPATVSNLNQFTFGNQSLSSATSFFGEAGAIAAQITGPFAGESGTTPITATDSQRHYNTVLLEVPKDTTVGVLFCARLDVDATEYPGASLSLRIDGQKGAQNLAIQPNNLLILPSLTITKVVSGGTATPNQWSFTVSPAINGQSTFTPDPVTGSIFIDNISPNGTYTVTENAGPANYTLTGVTGTSCTLNAGTSTANAVVAAGKPAVNASCTFTNTFVPVPQATLTVVKQIVNDGGGTINDISQFPLFVNGNSVISGVPIAFSPGTYTVTETNQAGYAATFSGACNAAGAVTLVDGDNVTCTITNDDIAPKLTVTKVVNGGSLTVSSFPLFVGSLQVTSGQENTFNAGIYAVTETNQANYTAAFSGDCNAQGQVVLSLADVKACTITNTFQAAPVIPGTLTVIKNVVNDNGGTKVAGDFMITVSGNNVSNNLFAGQENPGTIITLNPGEYAVDEINAFGYTKSLSADCAGTIASGEAKTCTITNNDPVTTGTLMVFKNVINNNNGNKVASDFTLNVTGTNVSNPSFAGSAAGTPVILSPGDYAVTEPNSMGYAKSFSVDCVGTIAAGETKTCTVINDDPAPAVTATLNVIKTVINNDAGTKQPADFTITVTGTNVSSSSFPGSALGTVVTLDAGSYRVDEVDVFGYNKTLSSDCTGSIAAGETKTCEIVNNDPVGGGVGEIGNIMVTKVVVNDNGGTKLAEDFPLFVGNAAVETGIPRTFAPGTYVISETNLPGYAPTFTGDCDNVNHDITIAANQTKTCTIINDDIAGVINVVDPAITKTVSSGAPVEGATIIYTITVTNGAVPVTGVAITDSIPSGITFVSSNPSQGAYDNTTGIWTVGDLAAAASATLTITATVNSGTAENPIINTATISALDQVDSDATDNTATATITPTLSGANNNPGTATLVVVKNVVNDNGGTLTAADFTLRLFATNASQDTFVGSTAGVTVTLDAGTYALRESDSKGYAATFSADCEGSIAAGETKTCTVTNNDPGAVVVSSGGGGGGGGGQGVINPAIFQYGGGGSGSSGGSGGGAVLGDTTTVPSTGSAPSGQIDGGFTSVPSDPAPGVLGAVTTLPRTGVGLMALWASILGMLVIAFRLK